MGCFVALRVSSEKITQPMANVRKALQPRKALNTEEMNEFCIKQDNESSAHRISVKLLVGLMSFAVLSRLFAYISRRHYTASLSIPSNDSDEHHLLSACEFTGWSAG